jgi:AAA domain
MKICHTYGEGPEVEEIWYELRQQTLIPFDNPMVGVITFYPNDRDDVRAKMEAGTVADDHWGFIDIKKQITRKIRRGGKVEEKTEDVDWNLKSREHVSEIHKLVKGPQDSLVFYHPPEDAVEPFKLPNLGLPSHVTVYVLHHPIEGKADGTVEWEGDEVAAPAVISTSCEIAKKQFREMEILLEVTDSGSSVLHHPTLGCVHSFRGVGKSHVALGFLYAIASAGTFGPYRSKKARKVLYVDGEMAGADTQEMLRDLTKPSENFCVITPEEQLNCFIPSIAFATGLAWLEEAIERIKAEVVCLDNWSALANVGTNDEEVWELFMAWMKKMRLRGVTIFYLHHDGKTGKQRGHSKPEDLLNWVIQLKWEKGYEGAEGLRCQLHFEKARRPVKQCSRINLSLVTLQSETEWVWSLPGEDDEPTEKQRGRPSVQPTPDQVFWLQMLEARPTAAQVQKEFGITRTVAERWIKAYVHIKRVPGELEAKVTPGAYRQPDEVDLAGEVQ